MPQVYFTFDILGNPKYYDVVSCIQSQAFIIRKFKVKILPKNYIDLKC